MLDLYLFSTLRRFKLSKANSVCKLDSRAQRTKDTMRKWRIIWRYRLSPSMYASFC